MLRDYLQFQGTIYLTEEELQDLQNKDGVTYSRVKTAEPHITRKKEVINSNFISHILDIVFYIQIRPSL